MSKDAKNVPALRFKGYSDAWEKRKLGDIFYQVSFFVNPEDAKLELWSLTVAEGLTPKSIRYDRNFLVRKQDKFKVVHSEDFVYNPMNITLGALDQNKLLKSVAVSGYYTTMSINRGFDGSFFKFLLSSPLMIRKYKNYATGSLLEKQRVQFSTFSIINIKAPKFDEQNKIGNFLIKLDHLIAATQRRIDALEQAKKALLQRLFDQSWRFKGYSDPWEKRKLGEVLFERNSRSGAKQLLSVTINQGVIKAEDSGRKDNSSSDLSNYKLVKVGDIPYNSMRMWQGASGYSYFEGIVSPAYTVLIPSAETDGLFLSYDIKRNKMLSVFQRHSQGLTSDTWNLKYPQLSSIHVRVPKKNEQKQIRQALIKLDDLIAATQSRLSSLELLKKALLQDLFI